MIPLNAFLTEKDLADQFVQALAHKTLDEKFFYWFPLSVRAWLELCSDGDYRNFVRSRSLIAGNAPDLAAKLPTGELEVLSIGSGQGDKDVLVLQALRDQGSSVRYVPVDTSQALLEMACLGAQGAGFDVLGVKADFTRGEHLKMLADGFEGPPRLVMMLGNTLGSVDPAAMARDLAGLLTPQDFLLVDGEIQGPRTLSGYDNPINRRFAWGPLNSVGITEDHGSLIFEEAEDPGFPGLHKVSKHFEASRGATAILGGEVVKLEPGERIEMNHSCKYTRERFLNILSDAGLNINWKAATGDGNFLMALAQPPER